MDINARYLYTGMTKNQLEERLQYFRDGTSKIVIATSVMEEGMDVPQCNMVILYDHVTNEIAYMQSRGN